MPKTTITLIPGDGIGPEVTAATVRVLDAAGAELEAAQGADPNAWRSDATRERIEFTPGLLGPQNTMRWANRPTMHQLMEFRGHR